MPSEFLTTDDLHEFKIELFAELRKLINQSQGASAKKWLRSGEVRKLLGISPGTLQNMRVNGTLPYARMGGVLYYDAQDIQNMLEQGKSQSQIRFGHRE